MNFKSFKNASILQKYFILSFSFFLISSLMIFGIATPNLAKIKKIRAEIITQKQTAEDKIKREINSKRLSEKLNKIEPELEKFNQIFINRNRELEFITTLENVASREQVTQKISFNLNADHSSPVYQKIPLEILAQGNYYDILRYINSLETLNYYINIKSLEFSSGAIIFTTADGTRKTTSENSINLKISANTYWR